MFRDIFWNFLFKELVSLESVVHLYCDKASNKFEEVLSVYLRSLKKVQRVFQGSFKLF